MNTNRRIPRHQWQCEDIFQRACERFGIPFKVVSELEAARLLFRKLLERRITASRDPVSDEILLQETDKLTEEHLKQHIERLLYSDTECRDLFEPPKKKRNRTDEAFLVRNGRMLSEMQLHGLNQTDAAKALGHKYKDNFSTDKIRSNKFSQDRPIMADLQIRREQYRAELLKRLIETYKNDPEALAVICWNLEVREMFHAALKEGDVLQMFILANALEVGLDCPIGAEVALLFAEIDDVFAIASRYLEKVPSAASRVVELLRAYRLYPHKKNK